jgi:hypothetical protein
MLQSSLNEFLNENNAPLIHSFPQHCRHRLDSISLLTMGISEQQLSHLYQILRVEKSKDFYLSSLAP